MINNPRRRNIKSKYTYDYQGEQVMIKKTTNNLENLQVNTRAKVSNKIEKTIPSKNELGKSKKKVAKTITSQKNRLKELFLKGVTKLKDTVLKKEQELDLRIVEGNPRLIVQNFKLKQGVTLKTDQYIIKNKKNEDFITLEGGEKKMTKTFFEKNLKGMHRRHVSADNRINLKKLQEKVKNVFKRNSIAHNFVSNLQVTKKLNYNNIAESAQTSESNLNKSKEIKIFFQNYQNFMNKTINEQNKLPFRIHESLLEEDEGKQVIHQDDIEQLRMNKLNEKYLNSEKKFFFRTRVNRPIDRHETPKILNLQHRMAKKRVKTGYVGNRVRNAKSNLRKREDGVRARSGLSRRLKSANLIKSYYN